MTEAPIFSGDCNDFAGLRQDEKIETAEGSAALENLEGAELLFGIGIFKIPEQIFIGDNVAVILSYREDGIFNAGGIKLRQPGFQKDCKSDGRRPISLGDFIIFSIVESKAFMTPEGQDADGLAVVAVCFQKKNVIFVLFEDKNLEALFGALQEIVIPVLSI